MNQFVKIVICLSLLKLFDDFAYSVAPDLSEFKYGNNPNAFVEVNLPEQSTSLLMGVDSSKPFLVLRDLSGRIVNLLFDNTYYELKDDFSWEISPKSGVDYSLVLKQEEKFKIVSSFKKTPGDASKFLIDCSAANLELIEDRSLPLNAFDFDAQLYFSKSNEKNVMVVVRREGPINFKCLYLFKNGKLVLRASIIRVDEGINSLSNKNLVTAVSNLNNSGDGSKDASARYAKNLSALYEALPPTVSQFFNQQKNLDEKIRSLVENYPNSTAYFKLIYDNRKIGSAPSEKEAMVDALSKLDSADKKVRVSGLMRIMQSNCLMEYAGELKVKLPALISSDSLGDRLGAINVLLRLQWNGYNSVKEYSSALHELLKKEGISPVELRNVSYLLDYSQGKIPKVEAMDSLPWWRENFGLMREYLLKKLDEKTALHGKGASSSSDSTLILNLGEFPKDKDLICKIFDSLPVKIGKNCRVELREVDGGLGFFFRDPNYSSHVPGDSLLGGAITNKTTGEVSVFLVPQ